MPDETIRKSATPKKPRTPKPARVAPTFDATETVAAASERVMRDRFTHVGTNCPVCRRFTKVYRRTLGLASLRLLVRIYRMQYQPLPGDTRAPWVKVGKTPVVKPGKPASAAGTSKPVVQSAGGDYAKMRWWGLIEPMPDAVRADGSTRVGWWRVTERGREFIRGRLAVRRFLYEYDGEPVPDPPGADTSLAKITDFYAEFDYQSLFATP